MSGWRRNWRWNETESKKYCEKCGKEIKYRDAGFNGIAIPLPCECIIAEREKEHTEQSKQGYAKTAEHWYTASGIKKRYKNILLDDITALRGQENAYDTALTFFEEYKAEQPLDGFGLVGGVGSGKTYITAALVNQIVKYRLESMTDEEKKNAAKGQFKPVPVRFISFTELFERLKPSNDEDSESLMQKVKNAKILVVDDLGACKITEWITDRLFEIVDYRYCEELPIIYTTNILPNNLKAVVDKTISDRIDRITDRLKEMSKIEIVTAQSQRNPPAK